MPNRLGNASYRYSHYQARVSDFGGGVNAYFSLSNNPSPYTVWFESDPEALVFMQGSFYIHPASYFYNLLPPFPLIDFIFTFHLTHPLLPTHTHTHTRTHTLTHAHASYQLPSCEYGSCFHQGSCAGFCATARSVGWPEADVVHKKVFCSWHIITFSTTF